MSVPPGKTPISYLQELCTKKGITPQYDLIANEGVVHEPTFVIRVTVGDITANGKGSSKKKAKHCAALAALKEVLEGTNGEVPEGEEKPKQDEDGVCPANGQSFDDGVAGNPIGELQEFTQKKLIKPPVYEFADEQGPPHAREFVCIVKLGKHHEKGTGRSKKTAKRSAASEMLKYIRGLEGVDNTNVKEEELDEEDEIPLAAEPRKSYTNLKDGKKIAVSSPLQAQQIQKFYEEIVKSNPKSVLAMQAQPLNIPMTNYCLMLQEIAEVQRFEVTYIDIREISVSGLRQCLVQLSTMPVAVCHGTGNTIDDAHGQAAHNALQYLKVMMTVKS